MLSNMFILVACDMSSFDVWFWTIKALGSLCIILHYPYCGEELDAGEKFVQNILLAKT